MPGLDPFVSKKLQYMYDVFYDINRDGKISWEDFEIYIKKISKTNGWSDTDQKHTHAKETLKQIWDGLLEQADDNADKEVSNQEWLKMWEDCVSKIGNKDKTPKWLAMYEEFMFSVADTSGDGIIDHDEFRAAYKDYGLTDKNIEDAFNRTTQNGATVLNKQNYGLLWNEFFSSNSTTAPGNYLFGHFDEKQIPQ